jgi:plastocyanin
VVLKTLGATLVSVALLVVSGGSGSRGAGVPQAGSLRGRVEIAHILSSSRPSPRAASSDDAAGMTPDVYRQAVVYLDPPPERLEKPSDARARMDQKNERFIPHLLAIASGTVVDFPNDDNIYHNVFSLSKTKRFDLGRYATGKSKAVRFDDPGVVRVFCEIHSHMNAFIVVFNHRFFTLTDEEGRFRIERVPPGTYRVTAWYEGVLRQTQTVTVPASGGAEANFVLK